MATILCVDDEPAIGLILEDTLARAGHTPIGARNVPEALRAFFRDKLGFPRRPRALNLGKARVDDEPGPVPDDEIGQQALALPGPDGVVELSLRCG